MHGIFQSCLDVTGWLRFQVRMPPNWCQLSPHIMCKNIILFVKPCVIVYARISMSICVPRCAAWSEIRGVRVEEAGCSVGWQVKTGKEEVTHSNVAKSAWNPPRGSLLRLQHKHLSRHDTKLSKRKPINYRQYKQTNTNILLCIYIWCKCFKHTNTILRRVVSHSL